MHGNPVIGHQCSRTGLGSRTLCCSPRGYVFVNGYYDHSVARRGVLFAPVYLNSGVYSQRGYRYSPSTVIDLRLFTVHLFSRPRYHHYYFGDYYANSYSTGGFFPSFSYGSSGRGYDPFYAGNDGLIATIATGSSVSNVTSRIAATMRIKTVSHSC